MHKRSYAARLVLLLVLAAVLPYAMLAAALSLMHASWLWWQSAAALAVATALLVYYLWEYATDSLRLASSFIAALREQDYSMRVRTPLAGDGLAEIFNEIHALARQLRSRHLSGLEAAALVRAIVAEIDSAIFAFDRDLMLRLINPAGEALLGAGASLLLGRRYDENGLTEAFAGAELRTIDLAFAGASGRYRIRRSAFRDEGRPHHLLVISDLSRPLREEELQAWRRLVRVISHELNNSLAPIESIASSLLVLLAREPLPADWKDDANRGLAVITSRAQSLTRFIEAYARLAKLPRPKMTDIDIESLVRDVAALEMRQSVDVLCGPRTTITADRDQLEQLLINLVRNAVDAARQTGGGAGVTWRCMRRELEIVVTDEGPGLSGTENLFVPFFTTKPGGTGIGLVLSRQIANAHGGSLMLHRRADRRGCEAVLRLPLRGERALPAVGTEQSHNRTVSAG